ncbi:FAD-dependent oxidoreductase [Ornithinimicrobium panacihumi]|uniref:FAD-dependent oxidoreductase n=1 Tax=Ornithinimicrobium panacihumi TaxID=2008449 RepID=UPI003F8C95CA
MITERSDLLLQTPASLGARFGLDVRVRHEVRSIDREAKVVRGVDLASGENFELGYEALVLSPGARPVRPPLPGVECALSLRDIEDTDELVAATAGARTAVVVGGGFIGVEMAENLLHRGLSVTLVEAADQVMAPLDPELAEVVHGALREAGVRVLLGEQVASIGADEVTTSAGTVVPADLVVLAIGVRPESALATDAGLATGPGGGIVVDDNLRRGTSRSIQWHELAEAVAEGATVVDVRSPGEHARGAIPGSVLLPLDELRDRLAELPEGPLVVHCAVGVRGHTAARILAQHGRDVRNLDGGYATWSAGVSAVGAADPAA